MSCSRYSGYCRYFQFNGVCMTTCTGTFLATNEFLILHHDAIYRWSFSLYNTSHTTIPVRVTLNPLRYYATAMKGML